MGGIWSVIHRYLDRLSVPGNGNKFQRYGFVFVVTMVFFFIKASLVSLLGVNVPFLFALFIVITSSWFGGFGPGILATFLTGAITYFFYLEPRYTVFGEENIPNIIILGFFFLEGFFISMMSESHRRSDIQKSEFIGIISHELKNPLTSIKGYAEMIQRVSNKNTQKQKSGLVMVKLADFAVRINRQVKRVTDMINEMLDITKIETGRLTYQDEVFNITDLVKEIVEDQQVTTKTHKILFSGKSDKLITGDRYRVGQVITNLISNAIKYAPLSKKINVRLMIKRSGVMILVEDFGPGIEKADQAKLFNPFFRAKKTQSAKGTGIGLFISSKIVERHQGKLWVESKIGRGSTFHLWLPLVNKKNGGYQY